VASSELARRVRGSVASGGPRMNYVALPIVVCCLFAAPLRGQQTVVLPARDEPLRDRATNVFTIGAEEGEHWEMFSGIRSLAFDRSDNLYLLDGRNARVLLFDRTGKFVRQIGKRGGGPGEFLMPMALDVTADGDLVVSDFAHRAFLLFGPGGEYKRKLPYDDLGMPSGGMAADPRGGIVGRASAGIPQKQAAQQAFATLFRHSLQEKTPASTLHRFPLQSPRALDRSGSARPVASMYMDPVFGPRPSFGVLPNGDIALNYTSEYEIQILDAKGSLTRTLTRAYTARKVSRKDQEAWLRRNPGVLRPPTPPPSATGEAPAAVMNLSVDHVPFAEVMTIVTAIRTDPQSRIWVQRRKDDGTDQGPIDLIRSDGRYIGSLPAQALPNAVSGSGLGAYVVTDQLGVERVVVRRLPQGWR
jgi:hypothetical protein